MEGWIKLHRKLLNWEWYRSDALRLFIHLLLTANHKANKWMGNTIERGQLVTGRKQLSQDTGLSEQTIRTLIVKLRNTGEITIKSTNKFSIITICNYDSYQIKDDATNQQFNQQSTNNQPASNHKQEYKKDNNDKTYYMFIEAYFDWFEKNNGVKPKMDGANGKAAKSIIQYLKTIALQKTDNGIVTAWEFILNNSDKWDPFYQQRTRLIDINSNIQNIISNLKNGNNKKHNSANAKTDDIAHAFFGTGDKSI